MKIIILDSVHCLADKEARKVIAPCLTVKVPDRIKTEYGTKAGVKNKTLMTGYTGTAGHFLTGLLPRIKKYCKEKSIKIFFTGKEEKIKPKTKVPLLSGIKFWEPQLKAIKKASRKGRGQIVLPTGMGKTVIALGLFFVFKNCTRLFLCHTNDIYYQTLEELKKYKFKNVFEITSKTDWKKIKKTKHPILISKVQSFAKIDMDNYVDFIDFVLVDEVHHVNKEDSQYSRILQSMLAPIRIGLTATPDPNPLKTLIAEGLFGPILYRLTVTKGVELGLIAKPKINLEVVPYDLKINMKGQYKFKNFYKYGIVSNRWRNNRIAEISKLGYNSKDIILILVEKIEHGEKLQSIFNRLKIDVPFIHGQTSVDGRKRAKENILSGKTRITIASRVWKEGINIPNLTHIINAAGYKDEKGVIQSIGRGLRTTATKKEVQLTDFLDPYRYLAEHAIARIQIYKRESWL